MLSFRAPRPAINCWSDTVGLNSFGHTLLKAFWSNELALLNSERVFTIYQSITRRRGERRGRGIKTVKVVSLSGCEAFVLEAVSLQGMGKTGSRRARRVKRDRGLVICFAGLLWKGSVLRVYAENDCSSAETIKLKSEPPGTCLRALCENQISPSEVNPPSKAIDRW